MNFMVKVAAVAVLAAVGLSQPAAAQRLALAKPADVL